MTVPQSRPRKWKQLLLKLGVFLLLGVVVNVAVAWGCALASGEVPIFGEEEAPAADLLLILDEPAGDRVKSWQEFVAPHESVSVQRGVGARWLVCHVCSGGSCIYSAICAGAPYNALSGWTFEFNGLEQRRVSLRSLKVPFIGTREFPTHPLWPGFAINTIFYAAMLWLLWIAPGRVKRFIRVHRGRCPACGFIIAPGTAAASAPGGGPCSECGFVRPH